MKFIKIEEIKQLPKTKIFRIHSIKDKDDLGFVRWHPPWRCYAFFPEENTVWSYICLSEIINFIEKLREERKVKTNG